MFTMMMLKNSNNCFKPNDHVPAEGCYPAPELQVAVWAGAIAAYVQLYGVIPVSTCLVPAAGTGQGGVQFQNIIIHVV